MSIKIREIEAKIKDVAGIDQGHLDGIPVYFSVKEMMERADRTGLCRAKPSGRFQINVFVPGENRERIFRTKKADGSFDVLGVVDAIKLQYRIRKDQLDRETNRKSNEDQAKLIREDYPVKNKYISSYASLEPSSYVAPSSTENKVDVQINFGSVDAETAVKIMKFVQSLEA